MILSEKSETLYRSRFGILRLMNTDVSRIFANDIVFFILALSVSLKNIGNRASTVISSVFTTESGSVYRDFARFRRYPIRFFFQVYSLNISRFRRYANPFFIIN
jgi:hypothetical protein